MSIDLSTVLGVIGIVTAILTAGRVVFVLEDRVASQAKAIDKFEKVADKFNGEAQSSFRALEMKVENMEKDVSKLATVERVEAIEKAILNEMRQSFRHLADLIAIQNQRHHDKDDA
jgi:hypothetical protein